MNLKKHWLDSICPSKIRTTKPHEYVRVLITPHTYTPVMPHIHYPDNWSHDSFKAHTPGLGIYTDGSRMEQDSGEFLAGVGVYYENTDTGESYKFGDANAILKAELDGIRISTEKPA